MVKRPRQLTLFDRPHDTALIDGQRRCRLCGQLSRFGHMTLHCPGYFIENVKHRLDDGWNYRHGEWRRIEAVKEPKRR